MVEQQDLSDLRVGTEVRYMLAGEGWKHIEKILRARIAEMEAEVLRPYSVARARDEHPLSKEDYLEVVAEKKGALMGLRLALDIPRAIVANADDILQRIPENEREEAMRDGS